MDADFRNMEIFEHQGLQCSLPVLEVPTKREMEGFPQRMLKN